MLIPIISFSQTQTTTASGNFYNPLNWDCLCVPANGDSLVINHAMIMTASIYYTAGQIKINFGGSLMEDGTNRDVWVAGGSLINNGVFDCYRLYISAGSFVNTGTSVYFDSLWNQGSISNQGIITAFDLLNDQTGSFNNGTGAKLVLDHDFMNQGYFFNNGIIDVSNDFSNCNIQTMDALFYNHGTFCIGADMINCIDDTLSGTGEYFIGGSSANAGVFDGSFTFNTPSGTVGVPGNIQPGVTIGNQPCFLSVVENELSLNLFPNPANNLLNITASNFNYKIIDLSGKIIQSDSNVSNQINIESLNVGIYFIEIKESNGIQSTLKFVKK